MNRLQQIPAPTLAGALLWAAALATAPLVAHAQPTVAGAFAAVETSTLGDFDESTDESATAANAATSSSDPDATVAGAATATYPDAAGVGGTAGAESTASLLSPLGVSLGFSNGLVFGEFIASGPLRTIRSQHLRSNLANARNRWSSVSSAKPMAHCPGRFVAPSVATTSAVSIKRSSSGSPVLAIL